jgi:hypothetical protein
MNEQRGTLPAEDGAGGVPYGLTWDAFGKSARLRVRGRFACFVYEVFWVTSLGWAHSCRVDGHIFGRREDAIRDAVEWCGRERTTVGGVR